MWLFEDGEVKSLLTYAVVVNTDDTGLYCGLQSVRKRSVQVVFYPQIQLFKKKHKNTKRYQVS